MEPRKGANDFTLFTLHLIWLMVRGNLSPDAIHIGFCCVRFFPPRQSHIHICLKKQSKCQAALNTSSTLEAKAVSSLSNNREPEVWIIRYPVHQRRVSQHPNVALAGLQAQDKELAILANAESGSKKHLFYRWHHLVKHGLIFFFYDYSAGLRC